MRRKVFQLLTMNYTVWCVSRIILYPIVMPLFCLEVLIRASIDGIKELVHTFSITDFKMSVFSRNEYEKAHRMFRPIEQPLKPSSGRDK